MRVAAISAGHCDGWMGVGVGVGGDRGSERSVQRVGRVWSSVGSIAVGLKMNE